MKTYRKLHESKEVANIHIAKIKKRGGEVKQSVQNGKILLEYSFLNENDDKYSLYNTQTNEVVSRGLSSNMVDDYFYRKNKIKNEVVKVINDVKENEIEISENGSMKLKKGIKPHYVGLNY